MSGQMTARSRDPGLSAAGQPGYAFFVLVSREGLIAAAIRDDSHPTKCTFMTISRRPLRAVINASGPIGPARLISSLRSNDTRPHTRAEKGLRHWPTILAAQAALQGVWNGVVIGGRTGAEGPEDAHCCVTDMPRRRDYRAAWFFSMLLSRRHRLLPMYGRGKLDEEAQDSKYFIPNVTLVLISRVESMQMESKISSPRSVETLVTISQAM
ncbi:hypothetical protein EV126DRAFT_427139 [Verticillium dahliae]|nr:hypothetical protein EV126DRAFT_427139 [Verticillium dahliae]